MNYTHPLNLFGGEKTKLDLLDGAQRRLGVREVDVRHDDGCCRPSSRKRTRTDEDGENGGAKRISGRKRLVTFKRTKATMKEDASSGPAEAFGSPCHQGACDLMGLRKD